MSMMFKNLDPPIDISIYALIGATAMMSGFARLTISLCVIVTELTGNTQYLLPMVAAVMCAKWVGDSLTKSVYEEISDLKSIAFLEHHPPHSTHLLTVIDSMETDVVCIRQVEKLSIIVEILRSNNHNGFPVITSDSAELPCTYRGFIERKLLLILLEQQQYHSVSHDPPGLLSQDILLSLLNRKWRLSQIVLPSVDEQEQYLLDLRPYMDHSQIVIQDTFSFQAAYKIFQTQGLRHLPVINAQSQVVGILTRQDLLEFHFQE